MSPPATSSPSPIRPDRFQRQQRRGGPGGHGASQSRSRRPPAPRVTTAPTSARRPRPTITGGSLVSGDTAAFTETFDTKNVGTGKTLTPAGSVSDGNSGNNYQVTFLTDTTGAITQTVSQFAVTAIPASITAGNNLFLIVTAEGPGGNVVTGYAGTVQFSSPDPLEPVPAPASPSRRARAWPTPWPPWRRPAPGTSRPATATIRAPVRRSRSRRRPPRRSPSASRRRTSAAQRSR